MGVTVTTFVGQNFGAGKMDRIHKGVRIMNWAYVVVALLMSAFVITLRETLFYIFMGNQ